MKDTHTTETSVFGHEVRVNAEGGKSSKISVDWTLFPSVYDLREVLKVLTENCDEYGGDYPRNNWKKLSLNDNFNHLVDHAMMGMSLSAYDKESAYEELTHAVCRALFCLYQLRQEDTTNA